MDTDEDSYAIEIWRIVNFELYEDICSITLCIICQCLPKRPKQCSGCESVICNECLNTWNQPGRCPSRCSNPKFGTVSKTMRHVSDQLKIYCLNKEKGCEIEKKLPSLTEHESNCEFRSAYCGYCNNQVLYIELQNHEETCPQRPVPCELCYDLIKFAEKNTHNNVCTEFIIQCQTCHFESERRNHTDHNCVNFLFSIIEELTVERNELKALNEKQAKKLEKIAKFDKSHKYENKENIKANSKISKRKNILAVEEIKDEHERDLKIIEKGKNLEIRKMLFGENQKQEEPETNKSNKWKKKNYQDEIEQDILNDHSFVEPKTKKQRKNKERQRGFRQR